MACMYQLAGNRLGKEGFGGARLGLVGFMDGGRRDEWIILAFLCHSQPVSLALLCVC
jgi:hypothetical protein